MIIEVYYRGNYKKGGAVWFRSHKNSKAHRLDGPAEIWYDGVLHWYMNGSHQKSAQA